MRLECLIMSSFTAYFCFFFFFFFFVPSQFGLIRLIQTHLLFFVRFFFFHFLFSNKLFKYFWCLVNVTRTKILKWYFVGWIFSFLLLLLFIFKMVPRRIFFFTWFFVLFFLFSVCWCSVISFFSSFEWCNWYGYYVFMSLYINNWIKWIPCSVMLKKREIRMPSYGWRKKKEAKIDLISDVFVLPTKVISESISILKNK